MREVNFSIPNVNKASVHITTTLYDRRALDCTSTLPLINSLNHLAYLTTSSARIRDILTVDGGVERLVCILKEGRSKDVMDMWKWNLAFQCVVNIGVRGSENVRTRVVEADMVPVIATILGNYIQIVERQKAKADAEQAQRNAARFVSSTRPTKIPRDQTPHSSFFERAGGSSEYRASRRQAPPPSLDLPSSSSHTLHPDDVNTLDSNPTPPAVVTSPPERTTFPRPQFHHHNRSHDSRSSAQRMNLMQPLATAMPSMDATDGFSIRPVRDVDRLPSMLPTLQTGIMSQPDSPATPSAPIQPLVLAPPAGRRSRRPSIRQQRSTSGASDDANGEESMVSEDGMDTELGETMVDVQDETGLARVDSQHNLLDTGAPPLSVTIPTASEPQDAETFNITHRSAADGSLLNTTATAVNGTIEFSPMPPPPPANIASPSIPVNAYPNFFRHSASSAGIQPAMPRDEDVLMSLQLLAYVSKYCDLRHYFQNTHLVPRLKIDRELQAMDGIVPASASPMDDDSEDDEDEEYLQPNDFNIFPLVEKFTVRHHSKDMQYWACVVMRNLCRKDDSKGGIRQCAYYECGKWEEFTRQFAKCRRCRRTKYCSKECQKSAWVYHRFVEGFHYFSVHVTDFEPTGTGVIHRLERSKRC
jgi:hypothetical protein